MSEQVVHRDSCYETHEGDIVPPVDLIEEASVGWPGARQGGDDLVELHPEHRYGHTESANRRLAPSEKAQTLREDYGFDAYSNRELDEAVENIFQRYPGARFQDILLRQKKIGKQAPIDTLRALVGEYRDFAATARAEVGILGIEILQELESVGPQVRFDQARDLSQAIDRRAVAAIRTQLVLDRFIESDGEAPASVDELNQDEVAELTSTIASMSVDDVRKRLTAIIDRNRNRYSFWVERIKEARSHYALRQLANHALIRLGVDEDAA